MEDLGDHRCWSSLVFTIQLLGYLILTHTHMLMFGLEGGGSLPVITFQLCLGCAREITVRYSGVLDHEEREPHEDQRLQLKLGTSKIPRGGQ